MAFACQAFVKANDLSQSSSVSFGLLAFLVDTAVHSKGQNNYFLLLNFSDGNLFEAELPTGRGWKNKYSKCEEARIIKKAHGLCLTGKIISLLKLLQKGSRSSCSALFRFREHRESRKKPEN
jgi:hypothetical protein